MGKVSGCVVGGTTGTLIGTLLGGIETGLAVASGAAGAAILNAAGHSGYVVSEAVKMGAIGGAIASVPLSVAVGCIAGSCVGMFSTNNKGDDDKKNASCGTLVAQTAVHVGLSTLVGMVGWAVLNAGEAATTMSLGSTAAAFATGSAVTMIPATAAVACLVVPLALCAMACVAGCSNDNDAEAAVEAPKSRVLTA